MFAGGENKSEQEFFGAADSSPGGLLSESELSLLISDKTFFFRSFADVGEFYIGFDAAIHVAIPEPSTLVLASIGFIGLSVLAFRDQRTKKPAASLTQARKTSVETAGPGPYDLIG